MFSIPIACLPFSEKRAVARWASVCEGLERSGMGFGGGGSAAMG